MLKGLKSVDLKIIQRQWLEVRFRTPSLGGYGYGSVPLVSEARGTDLYP